jgi:hypothetical protein
MVKQNQDKTEERECVYERNPTKTHVLNGAQDNNGRDHDLKWKYGVNRRNI